MDRKLNEFKKKLEQKNGMLMQQMVDEMKEQLVSEQEKWEIEKGIKFTERDRQNIEEIENMQYKLKVKEVTQKYVEGNYLGQQEIQKGVEEQVRQKKRQMKELLLG